VRVSRGRGEEIANREAKQIHATYSRLRRDKGTDITWCLPNSVGVNAGPGLHVVEVDVAVLGDQVGYRVLLGHLRNILYVKKGSITLGQ
jgi:hypothetical protein